MSRCEEMYATGGIGSTLPEGRRYSMSAKWRESQAWDQANLKGPLLWPVRMLLHVFSTITLAVVLLLLVVLYGISASVPVGLLALVPTVLLYGLTLLGVVAAVAVVPIWLAVKANRSRRSPVLFVATFIAGLGLIGAGAWLWWAFVWPLLQYDPATGKGFRLFAAFVKEYGAVTVRRLPGMEMSELEYYSWWPLRVILLLFVVNMVVSTIRRIEFTFKNLGVLTVHTGIVTIALGSVYYSGLKREGDTILFAGRVDPTTGKPTIGPPQDRFFDNTRVALYVGPGGGVWDYCPLTGVPRYNNYNLAAFSGESAWKVSGREEPWAVPSRDALNIACKPVLGGVVDPDISIRVVGYCFFADPVIDWKRLPASVQGQNMPLRLVYMHSSIPDDQGQVSDKPVFAFTLPPMLPKERIAESRGAVSLEYTLGAAGGMSDERWRDLSETVPPGTLHALVVEVPGKNFRGVYPVSAGAGISVADTGYAISVKELKQEPPFPIITKGYENAQSSMAVVQVTPPGGEAFDRWVYHRFPQISQDMLKELNARGMPKRRDADPAIRISLIEADQLNVYMDEPSPGRTRAIVRQKEGAVRVIDPVPADGWIDLGIKAVSLRIGERWDNAAQVQRPAPADEQAIRRDKEAVGTHDKAMLGVEVSSSKGGEPQVAWLPFSKYFGMGADSEREVVLPDGRALVLAFGRLQHALPGFAIQLADFEMIAYDHRGSPRDYQSVLRVTPTSERPTFETFEHVTKLNAPLTAPFYWKDERFWITNFFGRLRSGLSPYQFKFSQAGWDAQGWAKTQQQADAGMIPRPFASFTILGVGNNPGIHIIALGGILMGVGIPWAFYVKPWLVRREKKRIQDELAAGTYRAPRKRSAPEAEHEPAQEPAGATP